eukprot:scaffold86976_cov31-Tisochrysis_lutea.AAC.1
MRKEPKPKPSPVVDGPNKNFLVNGKQLAACLATTFNCKGCRKRDSLVPDESPAAAASRAWGSWGLTVCVRCKHSRASFHISLCAQRAVLPAVSTLEEEVAAEPMPEDDDDTQRQRPTKKSKKRKRTPSLRIRAFVPCPAAMAHDLPHLPKPRCHDRANTECCRSREHPSPQVPSRRPRRSCERRAACHLVACRHQ